MALKIWLPFTADANNRGTADCTLKSGSLSLVNSPLMKGQSLSNRLQFYSSELVGLKTFTISFFAQVTSCNDWDDICEIMYASGDFRFEGYNNGNITGWYNGDNPTHPVANSNHSWSSEKTWHHYVVVCDQSKVYTYYDGVLAFTDNYQSDSTKVSSMTGTFYIGQGSTMTGGISDFRIYDEPLSKRVIHEISKGLMTHYVLDNVHGGPENYALGTNTTTINWSLNEQYIGYTLSTYTDDSGVIVNKLTRNSSGNETGWNVLQYNKLNVSGLKAIPDTDITVSFDFRCSKPMGTIRIEMLTGGGANPISNYANTSAGGVANKWIHIKATLHIVTAANMPSVGGQVLYITSITRDAGAVFEMKNLIIVKGNADVPWHPAPSDTYYTALGFNSNTIPDKSGLGSNATMASTVTPEARSLYLSGTNNVYFTPYYSANQTVSDLTVSIWGKTNTSLDDGSNLLNLGTDNTFFRFRILNDTDHKSIWMYCGPSKFSATYNTGITLTDNTWHHYVVAFHNTAIKLFVDGKKIVEETHTGLPLVCGQAATAYIGSAHNASEGFKGSLYDLRIYGTCLSDDDIVTLYNTTASIDNYGNLVTYGVFNEDI